MYGLAGLPMVAILDEICLYLSRLKSLRVEIWHSAYYPQNYYWDFLKYDGHLAFFQNTISQLFEDLQG